MTNGIEKESKRNNGNPSAIADSVLVYWTERLQSDRCSLDVTIRLVVKKAVSERWDKTADDANDVFPSGIKVLSLAYLLSHVSHFRFVLSIPNLHYVVSQSDSFWNTATGYATRPNQPVLRLVAE